MLFFDTNEVLECECPLECQQTYLGLLCTIDGRFTVCHESRVDIIFATCAEAIGVVEPIWKKKYFIEFNDFEIYLGQIGLLLEYKYRAREMCETNYGILYIFFMTKRS